MPAKPHAFPLSAPAGATAPHDVLRALRIVHPFPTLLNAAATAGLALVAAGGWPEAGLLLRMLLFMLAAQSAIGVTNDIFDRQLDGETKPWKPLPSGAIGLRTAVALDAGLIAGAVALAATFTVAGLALGLLGMLCGLAYDVRLKRTPLSVLPFMVAIPVLPLWVWATLGRWEDVLGWLVPLGALIGVALHVANSLPDIDDDRRHGVEGFAHRLGVRGSMVVAWGAFGAALALSALIVPLVSYDLRIYLPAAAFGAACLAASAGAWRIRRDGAALQFGFAALGTGSAAVAVGWLAAVT